VKGSGTRCIELGREQGFDKLRRVAGHFVPAVTRFLVDVSAAPEFAGEVGGGRGAEVAAREGFAVERRDARRWSVQVPKFGHGRGLSKGKVDMDVLTVHVDFGGERVFLAGAATLPSEEWGMQGLRNYVAGMEALGARVSEGLAARLREARGVRASAGKPAAFESGPPASRHEPDPAEFLRDLAAVEGSLREIFAPAEGEDSVNGMLDLASLVASACVAGTSACEKGEARTLGLVGGACVARVDALAREKEGESYDAAAVGDGLEFLGALLEAFPKLRSAVVRRIGWEAAVASLYKTLQARQAEEASSDEYLVDYLRQMRTNSEFLRQSVSWPPHPYAGLQEHLVSLSSIPSTATPKASGVSSRGLAGTPPRPPKTPKTPMLSARARGATPFSPFDIRNMRPVLADGRQTPSPRVKISPKASTPELQVHRYADDVEEEEEEEDQARKSQQMALSTQRVPPWIPRLSFSALDMDRKTNKALWHSPSVGQTATSRSEFSDLLSEMSQTTLCEEPSQTTVGEEDKEEALMTGGSRSSGSSSGHKYEVTEGSKFFAPFARGQKNDAIQLIPMAVDPRPESPLIVPTSESQRWRMSPPGKPLVAMARVLGALVAESREAKHYVNQLDSSGDVAVTEGLMDSLYGDLLAAYMGEAPLVTQGPQVGERETDLFRLLTDLDEKCVGEEKRGEWLVCRANHEVSLLLNPGSKDVGALSASGEATQRGDDVNLLLTHVAMIADYFAFLHPIDSDSDCRSSAPHRGIRTASEGVKAQFSIPLVTQTMELLLRMQAKLFFQGPGGSMCGEWSVDMQSVAYSSLKLLSVVSKNYWQDLPVASMLLTFFFNADNSLSVVTLEYVKNLLLGRCTELMDAHKAASARNSAMDFLLQIGMIMHGEHFENLSKGPECLSARALSGCRSGVTTRKYFDPREAVALMYRIVLQPGTGIATALFAEREKPAARAADPAKVVALVESLLALPAHRLDVTSKGSSKGSDFGEAVGFHFAEMQKLHAAVEEVVEGSDERQAYLERIRLHLRVLVAVAGYSCRQASGGNVRRCFYNLRTMNFLAEQISFEHIVAVRAANDTRHSSRKAVQAISPVSVMDFAGLSEGYASDASTPQSVAPPGFDLSRAPSLRYDAECGVKDELNIMEEPSEQNMALYSDSSEDEDEQVYGDENAETPVTVPKLDMGLRGASSTGSFSGISAFSQLSLLRPESSESDTRPMKNVKTLSRTASINSVPESRAPPGLSLQCLAEDSIADAASPVSLTGVASLETLVDLYANARAQRALYASAETHALYLELLLQLMVMGEDGDDLDPLYCDPFPVQALTFGVNLSFLLYHHVNQAENQAAVDILVKRLKLRQGDKRGSNGMTRLLKLHCVKLLPTVLRSPQHTGGFAENIVQWRRINRGAVANICSASVPVDYLSGYYPGLGQDSGSQTVDLVMKCVEYPKSVHDMCPLGELFNEVMILDKLNTPVAAGGSGSDKSVVKMWDYGIDGESFCIVLSQAACSLREWRKCYGDNAAKRGKSFSDCKSLYFRVYKMVLDAVIAMSDAGVVHYDIKCDNVLVVPDPEHVRRGVDVFDFEYHGVDCQSMPFSVRIADFGESKVLQKETGAASSKKDLGLSSAGLPTEPLAPSQSLHGSHQGGNTVRNRGTEFIKAPEMLLIANAERRNHQQYDRRKEQGAGRSADVWGVSCLLYELLADEYLFRDDDWIRFFMRVTRETDELMSKERLALVDNAPEVIHFLKGALIRDPNLRPSLRNLKVRAQKLA